jgi:ADP-ribose pyrophosphatase YjhB (NUDIX family)
VQGRWGQWGLIGGAVDDDEALVEALCREVAEETGLAVRSYALFGTFSDPSRNIQYPDGSIMRIITLAYRVEVDRFDVLRRSDESTALRFVPPHELRQLDIAATHRHIVDHYLSSPRPSLTILE